MTTIYPVLFELPETITLFTVLQFLALPWLIQYVLYTNILHSLKIHRLDKYRNYPYFVLFFTFFTTLNLPFAAIITLFAHILKTVEENYYNQK